MISLSKLYYPIFHLTVFCLSLMTCKVLLFHLSFIRITSTLFLICFILTLSTIIDFLSDNSFYTNGVSLINAANSLQFLSNQCEFHKSLGYRWNPVKNVILIISDDISTYTIYSQPIPKQNVFFYL